MDVTVIFVVLTMLAGFDVARVGAKDDSNALPAGHLKPFGAHRPTEGDVDSLDALPDPKTFFEKYLKIGKPVLFRGAAKKIPAFKLWTDKYLAEKYGDLMMDVESGKKEDRSHAMKNVPFRKFLDTYKEADVYMVQDIQDPMKDDLSMLKPLMCGGFNLEIAVMWFSSGNTKSVLHTDAIENINCIFDGHKDIVFVDKKYKELMERVGWHIEGSFSDMDVEKVDMEQYGHLAEVPWWRARMEKGDCLYIPLLWYHTVASSKSRNLACNLWFNPMLRFNDSDCEQHKQPLPDYSSLATYKFSNDPLTKQLYIDNIRYHAFESLKDMEKIRLSDVIPVWKSEVFTEAEITKVFTQIDDNGDGVLSWDEVMKADIIAIVRQVPNFLHDAKSQHGEIEEILGLAGDEDKEEGEEGGEEGGAGEGDEEDVEEDGGREAGKDEL